MNSKSRMNLPKALFVLFLGISTIVLSAMLFSKLRTVKYPLFAFYNSDMGQEDFAKLNNSTNRKIISEPSNAYVGKSYRQMDNSLNTDRNKSLQQSQFEIKSVTTSPLDPASVNILFVGPKLMADDVIVINTLRNNFIHQPSSEKYALKEPMKKDFSMGQIEAVKPYLNLTGGGFFVECGALDGETRSNSLYLEREYNWTGLLVEADPSNFKLALTKHRKSYLANVCLSPSPNPSMLPFYQHFNLGRIQIPTVTLKSEKIGQALPCFPLFSIMLALNQTVVDFFSLDVEGFELDILMTIPFDKLYIKVMTVEFIHVHQGAASLDAFAMANGFTRVATVTHSKSLANDYVYVNNKEIEKLQSLYRQSHFSSSSPTVSI